MPRTADKPLSQTHENEVHKALTSVSLDANDFDWEPVPSVNLGPTVTVPRLFHRRHRRYFFRFDRKRAGVRYWISFAPGVNTEQSILGIEEGWSSVITHVQAWASLVKAEVEAPDLWAESVRERKIAVTAAATENESFTPDEQRLLRDKLAEIEAYVKEVYTIAEDQRGFLEGQFVYLKGALERLGKRDWLNVLNSTLIGLAINQLVPSDVVPNILRFAWTAMQVVFGHPLELPAVPPPS